MTVTVGIPTTGERPVLRRSVEAAICSASLVSQDAEVLVVVNGRSDAPGLGCVDSPLLRVIQLDQANVSRARNTAIAEARHDTVLFADDDVVVPQPWCAEMHAALRDPGGAVVTARTRVPALGPLTALLDYQRNFDSQPPQPEDPGKLLTANFGLRRDLIPAEVRFDENFTTVGEDFDFGHQLWAAGIWFRCLGEATPVPHELPEEIEPNIERCLRYGEGTVLVSTKRGEQPKLLPVFGSWYKATMNPDYHGSRKYAEFVWPDVRAAFRVYAGILNSAYLVGCLYSLGMSLGRPVIRMDHDQLTAAWEHAAARADELVSKLSAADWRDLPVDYARLAGSSASRAQPDDLADSIIADMKAALSKYAPLTEDPPAPGSKDTAKAGQPAGRGRERRWESGLAGPETRARVRQVLDELRGRDGPISEADIDNFARVTGLPFRVGCEIIERDLYHEPA